MAGLSDYLRSKAFGHAIGLRSLLPLQRQLTTPFDTSVNPNRRLNEFGIQTIFLLTWDEALPINDTLAFHPVMAPVQELYDEGKVAIVQGVGYPNSSRSHFRAMDIWHTCEPEKVSIDGWIAKAIRELEPHKEDVVTGVNLGRGLP